MKPQAFFSQNPFFRRAEFAEAYLAAGKSPASVTAALDYYLHTGVLLGIRRGVYMVHRGPFDAWLLPSKLHPDAVLAYDGAAWFHGLGGLHHSLCFLVPRRQPQLSLGEVLFRPIVEPSVTDAVSCMHFVRTYRRNGHPVAVTTLERTIVDCFDRLDRAPPLEEIFGTLLHERAPKLDADALVHWALTRAGPAGCARVGLLLAARPERPQLHSHLAKLEWKIPRRTTYATRDRSPGGMYFCRWHLLVPHELSRIIPLID